MQKTCRWQFFCILRHTEESEPFISGEGQDSFYCQADKTDTGAAFGRLQLGLWMNCSKSIYSSLGRFAQREMYIRKFSGSKQTLAAELIFIDFWKMQK